MVTTPKGAAMQLSSSKATAQLLLGMQVFMKLSDYLILHTYCCCDDLFFLKILDVDSWVTSGWLLVVSLTISLGSFLELPGVASLNGSWGNLLGLLLQMTSRCSLLGYFIWTDSWGGFLEQLLQLTFRCNFLQWFIQVGSRGGFLKQLHQLTSRCNLLEWFLQMGSLPEACL